MNTHAGVDLISVVMPCFNSHRFVEQAARSALEQDYGNVELIVVDDGSNDGSRSILARLEQEYAGRMRVICQNNQGPYPARNAGLRLARGTLVAFLDADDWWTPDCLGKLERALVDANADLSYCGWQNVGNDAPGGQPHVPPEYEAGDTTALFLRGSPWPIHAALVRRSLLDQVGGFSTRLFTSMDYELWLRIAAVTRNIVRVPEVLAIYRWHDQGQISAVKWRQVLEAWQVRQDFIREHPEQVTHIAPETLRELLDGSLLHAGYAAYWKRDLVSAQQLFRKAVRRGYWRLRDAKYVLPSFLPSAVYRQLIASVDRRRHLDT